MTAHMWQPPPDGGAVRPFPMLAGVFIVAFLLSFSPLAHAHQVYDQSEASLDDFQKAASAASTVYLKGQVLLLQWRVPEAAEVALDAAESEASRNPEAAYFLAHYHFLRGDYQQARKFLDLSAARDQRLQAYFEPYLAAALKWTDDYQRVQRAHFEFRFPKGIDEILVDYADETLTAAWEANRADLGVGPSDRIVVEFVPSADALSELTGLKRDAVDTTGTIAICKFNRLIVTTPRVTMMGYRWRDTLAHEYAHLVVTRVSANTVPIWLHEALARFQERRWSDPPGGRLTPYEETILARGLAQGTMVTLEQMHPSMAYLPSKEQGAMAYAEVLTILQFLHDRHGGYPNVRALLAAQAELDDLDRAFSKTYGFTVTGMQQRWKDYLRGRGFRITAEKEGIDIAFRGDSKSAPRSEEDVRPEEEGLWMGKSKGASYFRIGKMLKDRGRHKAALAEFDKARTYMGSGNMLLENAAAASWLKLDQPQKAIDLLQPLADRFDGPAMTFYNLASAYLAAGDKAKAERYFLEVVNINPFDPRSHSYLATLYEERGESARARQEKERYQKLAVYLTRQ